MITKMTKYSFILLSGQTEGFLNDISELGVIDITRSNKPVDEESLEMIARMQAIRKDIANIKKGEDQQLKEMRASYNALVRKADGIRVWGNFDAKAIEDLKQRGIQLHFYKVSDKKFKAEWAEEYPIEVINRQDGKTYFVLVSKDGEEKNFPIAEIPAPSQPIEQVDAEIKKAEKQIEGYKAILENRKSTIPELEEDINEMKSSLERHLAQLSSEKAAEDTISVMVGFAPTEDDKAVCEALDKLDVFYIKEDAVEEDNPPIKLKNNWFTSMFSTLTGMYGMPVYGEFDPTPFLSIFFLLFFAMCMGDAGYGIMLVIIGLLLKGKKGGLANLYGLIIALGVGTFIVGIIMGAFFGVDLTAQSWVPDCLKSCMVTGEIAGYSAQMVCALGIGVVHICLALIVKAVNSLKRSGFKESISTIGWTLLIVGTVIVLAFAIFGAVSESTAKWIIIGIASVSALGIYIFNKPGRNPLINIGSGLWDTYNMASGLMGDVLSYIRLYALGLSGGMLGSTFNSIAEMVKGCGVPGLDWVGFILILILGHAINLAMSCLGAFVHPLRLNFVEFFKNSGYEGKGKDYKPLKY